MNNKLNHKLTNPLVILCNSVRPSLQSILILLFIIFSLASCKKLIEIPPPVSTITTSQVFQKNEQAIAATTAMYFQLINSGQSFGSYSTSIFTGLSADELKFFQQGVVVAVDFERNSLQPTNGLVSNNFWSKAYFTIYSANAIIAGLNKYNGVNDSIKNELIGEAKFIRAFCNFYLTNLFGDVPLVTSTNWRNTNLIAQTATSEVYESILNDLHDAENRLATDYSVGNGERIIPTKWAAKALLARTYLYKHDWANAEIQSSEIINNSTLYSLLNNLNDVFLMNSDEAIWQLKQSNSPVAGSNYNATPEGAMLIPRILNSTYPPYVYLSTSLLATFEPTDQRLIKWVDSTNYNGVVYYFPYKYKTGVGQAIPNGPYSEYYMVFRVGEQYLIRAEARAMQNKLIEAISDLNKIRQRAGLNLLSDTLTQQQVLDAVEQERRIELFAEWGNRWLDLKRWGKMDSVLAPIKGSNWQPADKLYPIPQSELVKDPNLIQNPGY